MEICGQEKQSGAISVDDNGGKFIGVILSQAFENDSFILKVLFVDKAGASSQLKCIQIYIPANNYWGDYLSKKTNVGLMENGKHVFRVRETMILVRLRLCQEHAQNALRCNSFFHL